MSSGKRASLKVFIALGSNLGDTAELLGKARELIQAEIGPITASSLEYLSEPWGDPDQPWFRNQVVEVSTQHAPRELIRLLLEMETRMGRVRTRPNAPRTIDLDLLACADQVIDEPGLQVPHPRLALRNFVLIPLMEISGDWVHPVLGQTAEELYLASEDPLEVCLPDDEP